MINLYNNHQNSNLKFSMDITGVSLDEIKPRLVIESGDSIYMVKGQISKSEKGNECKFSIPVLEGINEGNQGNVYYEVIIKDEQYQKVWEENFEVISKTEVKVLESNFTQEVVKEEKPKINLNSVVQIEESVDDEESYEESGLKEPEKADLNDDGKISEYEKKRGEAIEDSMEEEMEKIERKKQIYTETNESIDEDEVFSFDKFVRKNK